MKKRKKNPRLCYFSRSRTYHACVISEIQELGKNSLAQGWALSISYPNKPHIHDSKRAFYACPRLTTYFGVVGINQTQLTSDQVRSRDSSGGVPRSEWQPVDSTLHFASILLLHGSFLCFFPGCPSSSLSLSSSSLKGNFSSAIRLTNVSAPTECPPTAVFKNGHPWRRSACQPSRVPEFSPDSCCSGPPAAFAVRSELRYSLFGARFRFRGPRCPRERPARSSPRSAVDSLANNPETRKRFRDNEDSALVIYYFIVLYSNVSKII